MSKPYDAIVVITPSDYERVHSNFERILNLTEAEKIVFIGSTEVGEMVAREPWAERAGFVDEEEVLPFEDVRSVFKKLLQVPEVPRGLVGWYYQQFLKMKYAIFSNHEYYLTWDGDTVPTKKFSMFKEGTDTPFFDMKYECHEEYFTTLNTLLGFGKVIKKSFISEHMLFNVDIMKSLIKDIEARENLKGTLFYEKILNAIRISELQSNSFSEFETYGSYVAMKFPIAYRLKDWHSIRYGAVYFKPEELTEADYEWFSKDFDAVSFEKDQEYNPEIAAVFKNPGYRNVLTARQIIEAIQDASTQNIKEEWN